MRGVGSQVDGGLRAGLGCEGALGAEVVLDVAGALDGAGNRRAVELGEDLRVLLAREVREHVEAPAVRHADAHLLDAGLRRRGHHRVHQRDQRLAALEREALLANVLGLQERLEGLRRVEAVQDPQGAPRGPAWCSRTSSRSWNHARCARSAMCMYSSPMVRQ